MQLRRKELQTRARSPPQTNGAIGKGSLLRISRFLLVQHPPFCERIRCALARVTRISADSQRLMPKTGMRLAAGNWSGPGSGPMADTESVHNPGKIIAD